MIQLNRRISFAKINGKADTLAARKWGISGFPTIVLLDKNGDEIDRIVGYLPPAEFLNTVNMYMKGKETLDDYLKRARMSPDSVEPSYKIGEKYEGRSEFEDAGKYYRMVIDQDPTGQSGLTDDAMNNVGGLAYRQKDFEQAIGWEEKVIEQLPESELSEDCYLNIPYYYSKWANYQLKNGDPEQAKILKDKSSVMYKQFLEKFPASEETEWVNGQIKSLEEN